MQIKKAKEQNTQMQVNLMQAFLIVNPLTATIMQNDADRISIFALTDPKIFPKNLLAKLSPRFQETECTAQDNTRKVKAASPKQCKEEKAKSGFISSKGDDKGGDEKKLAEKKLSFILYLTIIEIINE